MNQSTELKEQVAQLIADTELTHRYSMSRIYGLYNKVFATNEQPQTCASCLIRKIRQLKTWLAEQVDIANNKEVGKRPDEKNGKI